MKFSYVDPETASAVYDMQRQPAAAGPGGPKGSPLNGGNPADYFLDDEDDGAFDPDSKYVWKGGAPNQGGFIPDMYRGSEAARQQGPGAASPHAGRQKPTGAPAGKSRQNPAPARVNHSSHSPSGAPAAQGRQNPAPARVNHSSHSLSGTPAGQGRMDRAVERVGTGRDNTGSPSAGQGAQSTGRLRIHMGGPESDRPATERSETGWKNTGRLRISSDVRQAGTSPAVNDGRRPESSSADNGGRRPESSSAGKGGHRVGSSSAGNGVRRAESSSAGSAGRPAEGPARTALTGRNAEQLIGGHPVLATPCTAMNDPCFAAIRPYVMTDRIMHSLRLPAISGIRMMEGYPLPPGNVLLALFSKWLTEGSLRMDRQGQKTVLVPTNQLPRPDSRTEQELWQSLFRHKGNPPVYDTDTLRQWYLSHRDDCASLGRRMAAEGLERMAGLSMIGFASESGEQPVLSRDGRGLYGCILNMNIMLSNPSAAMKRGLFREEQIRDLAVRAPLFLRQKAMLAFLAEHQELTRSYPSLAAIGPLTAFLEEAFMAGGTTPGSPA